MDPFGRPRARLRSVVRNLFRTTRVEHDLDADVRAYVDLLADEKVRAGLAPADARRAALVELGGVERVKDDVRDVRAGSTVDSTMRDMRYAVRALIRRPGFTAVAVTAIALGIGATTAIFSVVNSVLLRPLPYREPNELVVILHDGRGPVAPANYLDWKRQSSVFASVGAAQYWSGTVSGDVAERVQGLKVTSDILAMTGVRPLLGRLFRPEDDIGAADRPVVLAWGYWQRRFAGSRDVLGQHVLIDGESYTVVGVMPRGFDFPMFWATGVQMWAPLVLGDNASSRRSQSLRVFARLAPAATVAAAQSQMTTIAANLERAFPGTNRGVTVTPLVTMVVGDVRTALFILLGAVGFVLLIACANVAHMLLARASARQREMTVRLALGASRTRVVRQMLVESVVLALAGGALGVGLAQAGLRVLVSLAGDSIPRAGAIGLDPRVLAFTTVLAVVTGLAFGLLPAMRVSRGDMSSVLRDGARGSTEGAERSRIRSVLVASEIALALVLLTGAGLAMRSFVALRSIDAGFDPHGVLSAVVTLQGTAEAPPGRRESFYTEVVRRVGQLPGVESASLVNHLPIAGDNWGLQFLVEGQPRPEPADMPRATYRVVFPGYFRTMRLPILRGRDITERDRVGTPPIALVNEYFARRHWPNDDAVGKRITLDPSAAVPAWVTIVGIVKNDVQSDWSAPPTEEVFLPYLQDQMYLQSDGGHVAYMTLVARASCTATAACQAASLAPGVREAIGAIDRSVPVTTVQTMDDVVAGATARPRFTLALLATFAAVALVLAAVGIYGVISYAVSRRTHEIGVRIALGATPAGVVRLVMGQGMRVVAAGVVVGLGGAALLSRVMTTVVYGVQVTDPLTYGGVALLLVAVALIASYVPAWRATKVDPLTAMRAE
jgi:putative ABC transport system permease protein